MEVAEDKLSEDLKLNRNAGLLFTFISVFQILYNQYSGSEVIAAFSFTIQHRRLGYIPMTSADFNLAFLITGYFLIIKKNRIGWLLLAISSLLGVFNVGFYLYNYNSSLPTNLSFYINPLIFISLYFFFFINQNKISNDSKGQNKTLTVISFIIGFCFISFPPYGSILGFIIRGILTIQPDLYNNIPHFNYYIKDFFTIFGLFLVFKKNLMGWFVLTTVFFPHRLLWDLKMIYHYHVDFWDFWELLDIEILFFITYAYGFYSWVKESIQKNDETLDHDDDHYNEHRSFFEG